MILFTRLYQIREFLGLKALLHIVVLAQGHLGMCIFSYSISVAYIFWNALLLPFCFWLSFAIH